VRLTHCFRLIATPPVWLYQLWAFIAPGLYARERRWTYLFVGAAVPLFAGGAALAYLVMSRGLAYLLNLTPHGVAALPTISTYLSHFRGTIRGFGVTFELPLALIVLNLAHDLTHARFRKWRRLMIFGVFLFAGICSTGRCGRAPLPGGLGRARAGSKSPPLRLPCLAESRAARLRLTRTL
jgi:sec-independent protein translocase protein TatC